MISTTTTTTSSIHCQICNDFDSEANWYEIELSNISDYNILKTCNPIVSYDGHMWYSLCDKHKKEYDKELRKEKLKKINNI